MASLGTGGICVTVAEQDLFGLAGLKPLRVPDLDKGHTGPGHNHLRRNREMTYESKLFIRGLFALSMAPIGPIIGSILWKADFLITIMAFTVATCVSFLVGFWWILRWFPVEESSSVANMKEKQE